MDKPTNNVISLIVVNWNGKHFLKECFESIKKQTFKEFEVIFVDNGSTDGSSEWVAEHYGDFVTIVQNEQNRGFAEGNNQGILRARGRYMVLINNDTVLKDDFLEELMKPAVNNSDVGMCASKILFYDNPSVIDATGQLLYWDGLNRQKGHFEVDNGKYNVDCEILFPPGCGSLYKKEMLEEIGLFDEDFFAYGEDTDLGLRARIAGWKCVYVHRAVIYHKRSGSTGEYSAFKAFHVERNRLWVAVKIFPLWLLLLNPFFTIYRLLFQAYGIFVGRGAAGQFADKNSPWRLIGIFLRAYTSAIFYLPRMMKKRRLIQRKRKTANLKILPWFRQHGISAKDIALMN